MKDNYVNEVERNIEQRAARRKCKMERRINKGDQDKKRNDRLGQSEHEAVCYDRMTIWILCFVQNVQKFSSDLSATDVLDRICKLTRLNVLNKLVTTFHEDHCVIMS